MGNETNSYQVLKSIYDWMTVNIRYPTGSTGGEPQSAVQTLLTKVGDCDDQSILFCSLARAAASCLAADGRSVCGGGEQLGRTRMGSGLRSLASGEERM